MRILRSPNSLRRRSDQVVRKDRNKYCGAMSDLDLAWLAATLEASGQYRVLRRLTPRSPRRNGDDSVPPRCWFIDVADADKDAELRFLRESIYGADVEPLMRQIGSYDRFSDRC